MTQLSINKHTRVAELRQKVEAQSVLIRFYQSLPVDWEKAPPGSRKRVANLTNRILNPRKAYYPWTELKREMRVRKLSVSELARQVGVTPSPDIDAIMASLQATVRKTWENRVRLAYAQMAFTDSANTPPNTPDDSIPPPY